MFNEREGRPYTPEERAEMIEGELRRQHCEKDHMFFMRYFFKQRMDMKFLLNWHHYYLADELELVIKGETENLAISVTPGSSKTEEAVINLIARGLALNKNARFLHLSSQENLTNANSEAARDIVQSEEYQTMWPMATAKDSKATYRWNVMDEGRKAGGVYAVPLGGQVTGFRAGRMKEGFQGAMLIDDPLKADDAYSLPAIKKANRQLATVVKTRKAWPATPVIVIMQRLNVNDAIGFIKGGNVVGKWKFVTIPALITEQWVKDNLPPHIQKLVKMGPDVERDEKGRFSFWPIKERLEDLLALEKGGGIDAEGNRVSRFMFASQYMQAPTTLGGGLIKGAQFVRYTILPKLKFRNIYGDTAQKTAERNDFSVLEDWGLGEDGKVYLTDLARGKWEAPELERRTIDFWKKRRGLPVETHGNLRKLKVEDKSSGTGLIQKVKLGNSIPVEGIQRNKDKLTRVMDVLGYIEAGYVCVPAEAEWVHDFIAECEAFTADDTHQFDDQIDPMVDAILDLLGPANKLTAWQNLL